MGCYKLVLESRFEGFGWTLMWFQTQSKDLQNFENYFPTNKLKNKNKDAVCTIIEGSKESNPPKYPQLLYEYMLLCELLELHASK